MYLIYIVRNDGIGAIGPATFDLTCEPSECYWLVPGTEQDDAPKPNASVQISRQIYSEYNWP